RSLRVPFSCGQCGAERSDIVSVFSQPLSHEMLILRNYPPAGIVSGWLSNVPARRPTGRPVVFVPFVWKEHAMRGKRLTTQQKQEIFQALVSTQDLVQSVRKSYEVVTEKFEINETQLRQIEDEGIDKEWPPLSEAVQAVGSED